MPKRTRTHPRTHTHKHPLFQSVVLAYTPSEPSFVWLWVAECGARSLAACQGTRQLSPQTHPVLGGKRRWGRRPCFWGNLEFATFSWVTIHSRSNSRLADVMLFSPSLCLRHPLSHSFLLSLYFLSFQLWEVGAPKGFSECVCFRWILSVLFMLACVCVCFGLKDVCLQFDLFYLMQARWYSLKIFFPWANIKKNVCKEKKHQQTKKNNIF